MIRKIGRFVKKNITRYRITRKYSKEELIQYERVQPWFAIQGDKNLRIDYDLNSNSVVFDLGGYKGEFSSVIFCKYDCNIYIFEPINSFYQIIVKAFSHNTKVKCYNFGLGSQNEKIKISLTDNASSVYIASKATEEINLKSIVSFVKENNINEVDLIKLNIEGGEYEVLEILIEDNLIHIFKNIQVQFHDFIVDNARERMIAIHQKLAETHELTFQFEFVWENWRLK